MIYLDYAANTPADKRVLEEFVKVEQEHIFNANSTNVLAKETKALYERSIKTIVDILGVKENELIMTSSATESNNLLIKGIAKHNKGKGRHIITTFLEHSSVNGPIGALITEGYEVDYVDIDSSGNVDKEHLLELLREDTILVAICHIDSEIGLIQNINELASLIKENSSSHFHVDGTQALGKIKVDLSLVDSYAFAAHKFYGINGCGGLVLKTGIIIEPLHHGGISSTQFRSGSPALGLVASSALALKLCDELLEERLTSVTKLNTNVKEQLAKYERVRINSNIVSSPYIINISFNKIKGEVFKNKLAEVGICLSTKSACSAVLAPSRAVYALTNDRKAARSTLRISLSHTTTIDEIKEFLEQFDSIYNELNI